MAGSLTRLLGQKRALLLDGAMGTELHRRGVHTGLPLWSASALLTDPGMVLSIHRDYLLAGADIITTNTFRTTHRTFQRAGIPDRSSDLVSKACALAREARSTTGDREVLIAGSVAPLEDCYRPDLVPSASELEHEHGELTARLSEQGVDFILLETMGTIREAHAACIAARNTGKEVIVSLLCGPGSTLYGGESLEEAIAVLSRLEPVSFSLNCLPAASATPLLARLRDMTSLPLGIYANAGIAGREKATEDLVVAVPPDAYAGFVSDWIHLGVSIVGGCCGTTPDHIRAAAHILSGHAETTVQPGSTEP